MSYESIEQMASAVASGIRPPERLTVSQAAEKYRFLNNPGSYVGYWDNQFAPYLVEPMDALTSIEHTGMVFAGPARTGKALALDTPIPTPNGWTTMGDLAEGDQVLGCDGSSCRVVAATEVMHDHRCYRVTVGDGSYLIADAGHKWTVHHVEGGLQVVTTEDLKLGSHRVPTVRTPSGELVKSRAISSVEEVPSVPVRCIQVDTEDHIFLAGESFIPTHNSDMFFNWLVYTAICDPADMMMVHMTMNVARDWSQKDLRRSFRHSKELGATVAPGRHNQSTHDIRFLSGMHLLVKWPTITELSGKTVGRNWIADYDRISPSIDDEGSAFSLTSKRAETYRRHGMTVAESSPGFDIMDAKWQPSRERPHEAPPVEGGVLSLYNQGDRRRWYWRCPHCAEAFEPDFKLLVIPDSKDLVEAAEATVMACPHCGGEIHHDGKDGLPGKHELNQVDLGNAKWVREGQFWIPRSGVDAKKEGRIEGKGIRSDLAAFWLKGPAANFADWRSIVLRYLQAVDVFERTGAQEGLKTTINTDQGLPYLPKGMENGRLPEDIKAMSEDLGERVVPPGVRFLVATIDVQKGRFEVQVSGFGYGGDLTVIDRFALKKSNRVDEDGEREPLRPASYLEDWDLLIENVLMLSYPLADGSGREMQIRMVGCDSGGSAGRKNDSSTTKTAYAFWRRLKDSDGTDFPSGLHRRFLLLKGGSTNTAPRVKISYPDSERRDRHAGARGDVPVLMLNTTALKDQLDAMLDRERSGGGKLRFADWLPDDFWDEMVAEARTATGWEKLTSRNEAWDLLVYAIAISLYRPIRIESLDWDEPPGWAAEWDENDMVFDPADGKKPAEKEAQKTSLRDLAAALA